MLTQMKRPTHSGLGRRNNTVEAIRVAHALKLELDEAAARLRRGRPQALPLNPAQRALHHIGQRVTPAQHRRAAKKELRNPAVLDEAKRINA